MQACILAMKMRQQITPLKVTHTRFLKSEASTVLTIKSTGCKNHIYISLPIFPLLCFAFKMQDNNVYLCACVHTPWPVRWSSVTVTWWHLETPRWLVRNSSPGCVWEGIFRDALTMSACTQEALTLSVCTGRETLSISPQFFLQTCMP